MTMQGKKHVIVDVDVGVDDFLALLVLLNAEKNGEIKIEAITCSNGNASVENVCKNVARILEITKRKDVSIKFGFLSKSKW